MKYRYLKKEKQRCLPLAKKIFSKYFGSDRRLKNFFHKLQDEDKEKFLKSSFFYYHRWWNYSENIKKQIDESFSLIVFSSIIETIISEVDYKDFKCWYDSDECVDKNKGVNDLWEEYIKKYRATKKFIYFFNNYLSDDDKELLKNFKVRDNKDEKFVSLSLDRIAKVLYQLRSNFVHNADYVPIPRGHLAGIAFSIKNKHYYLRNGITIDTILKIFEKGFVEYFKKKIL